MTIADRLAAAEPTAPRRLGGLIERLATGGALRGARDGDGPIDPPALGAVEIRGIAFDSRSVRPGSIFVAIVGLHADGHEFVGAAERAGAAAVVVERPVAGVTVPQVVVRGSRRALAVAASWWYGDPSRELGVVGITGTDGKTTTAYLAVAGLTAAGVATGMIGTVATRIGGEQEDDEGHATTPEAPALQAALRAMTDAGDEAAIVETTSHGLALDRVAEIDYDIAILTNLTHEHLELHGTWEAYRDAKLRLFEMLGRDRGGGMKRGRTWPRSAIVNLDDASAGAFIGVARDAGAQVLTYGMVPGADIRATRVAEDRDGIRVAYDGPDGQGEFALRLAGRFNVHNALAVVGLGVALDVDREALASGLAALDRVPGRMERLEAGQPFDVVVDYAHSPASLATVLDLLAPVAAARGGGLIAVFGSAGERDTTKRPIMGRIAGERCRIVVVTDEDPRGEDSFAILDQIARGAEAAGRQRGHDLLTIADREAAIETAFELARPGDVVLLAGKGHERSIIGPDGPIAWDERAVAHRLLARRGGVRTD